MAANTDEEIANPVTYLIVDDHAPFRKMIHAFLPEGYRKPHIVECSDGDEAIDRYADLQPDWVLMDVQMARVDGLTATRTILENAPEARVIILTQFDSPEIREAVQAIGAFALVLKENLDQVAEIIESAPPNISFRDQH